MYISSKMTAYRRDFNKTKCTSFLIKDERLIENTMKLRKKVSNIKSATTLTVNWYIMKNI